MTQVTTADVIVVGAGIAGLVTALSIQESGRATVLVEKQPQIGGSSAMSGGFFAFWDTDEQRERGVEDSRELFRSDLIALGGGAADESLIDAYLDAQHDTYRWLKDHGVSFDAVEVSSGQSAARSHHADIRTVLDDLAAQFETSGGTLLTGHAVRRLLLDDDRVTGVVADAGAETIEVRAPGGVVLCSGGFSRATDLLAVFAPDQRHAIPYGGQGNTGDGLRMAWLLGAGMADMGYVAGTYGSHPDTGDEFHELLTAYYLGAIIVNERGERFVDESQSYKVLGRACLHQPDGLGFQVFDATVRAKSHPGLPLKDMEMLERQGHLHHADTLEELAEVAGIDASALGDTIAQYNEVVSGARADPLGRSSLVNGGGALVPIETAPFYAYPAKSLMTTTYAGITVTPRGEVTRIDGSVIPGLFAVGEIIGGFHGEAYMTGSSLGKGAVFGRVVAAETTARLGTVRR
jgi:fumarate reductase flavoprotein subunit